MRNPFRYFHSSPEVIRSAAMLYVRYPLSPSFGAKGVRASAPAGLQTAIEEGSEEDGPVPIEIPIEAGSEASPWPSIHPTTGR